MHNFSLIFQKLTNFVANLVNPVEGITRKTKATTWRQQSCVIVILRWVYIYKYICIYIVHIYIHMYTSAPERGATATTFFPLLKIIIFCFIILYISLLQL